LVVLFLLLRENIQNIPPKKTKQSKIAHSKGHFKDAGNIGTVMATIINKEPDIAMWPDNRPPGAK
jgi:hypothetical protein